MTSNTAPAHPHATATVDSQAKKTWSLGMIDDYNGKDIASVSFFKPVPGRMGENRVAFFGPEEEEEIDAGLLKNPFFWKKSIWINPFWINLDKIMDFFKVVDFFKNVLYDVINDWL